MINEQWWSRLKPATRAWLIDNNGDAVPDDVATEVATAGGPVAAEVAAENGPQPGLFYPDDIVDWVEEIANDEDPLGSA
jgi:hypothetical protein